MKNYFNSDDEKLKWSTGKKNLLLKTCVFDVTESKNTSASGVSGNYIVLDAADWVIVIPEIDDDFIMVKQWRHGAKSLSVEFPGGVIDKGEKVEEAAARELKEETGYIAGKMTYLGVENPNPALFSNHVHFFLAQDLKATGIQTLDSDEFINYITVPKKDVLEVMGTEQAPHALMATALSLYFKYLYLNNKKIEL